MKNKNLYNYICSECSSNHVRREADCKWNAHKQEWEIANFADKDSFCITCNKNVKTVEVVYEEILGSHNAVYCPSCGEILTEIPRNESQRKINDYEYDESIWFLCKNGCFNLEKVLIYGISMHEQDGVTVDSIYTSPNGNDWSLSCEEIGIKNEELIPNFVVNSCDNKSCDNKLVREQLNQNALDDIKKMH